MGATLKIKECDTMRILVVDDDRLLNHTLCYNLNTAGYTVDSALTKSVAGSFLTKQDYDLIVLDVNLPDGNGFDFCREVKERRPDTAIIFLTANDMESDMLKGYELGAEDYVTKPFPMSVFQKKLAVVLGRLTKQYGGDECCPVRKATYIHPTGISTFENPDEKSTDRFDAASLVGKTVGRRRKFCG